MWCGQSKYIMFRTLAKADEVMRLLAEVRASRAPTGLGDTGPWVGHSQHSLGWDTANTAKKTSDDALAVWPLLLTEGQHVCVVFEDTEGLRHSPHNHTTQSSELGPTT